MNSMNYQPVLPLTSGASGNVVLPYGWKAEWSVEHARYFYFNFITKERTWTSPALQQGIPAQPAANVPLRKPVPNRASQPPIPGYLTPPPQVSNGCFPTIPVSTQQQQQYPATPDSQQDRQLGSSSQQAFPQTQANYVTSSQLPNSQAMSSPQQQPNYYTQPNVNGNARVAPVAPIQNHYPQKFVQPRAEQYEPQQPQQPQQYHQQQSPQQFNDTYVQASPSQQPYQQQQQQQQSPHQQFNNSQATPHPQQQFNNTYVQASSSQQPYQQQQQQQSPHQQFRNAQATPHPQQQPQYQQQPGNTHTQPFLNQPQPQPQPQPQFNSYQQPQAYGQSWDFRKSSVTGGSMMGKVSSKFTQFQKSATASRSAPGNTAPGTNPNPTDWRKWGKRAAIGVAAIGALALGADAMDGGIFDGADSVGDGGDFSGGGEGGDPQEMLDAAHAQAAMEQQGREDALRLLDPPGTTYVEVNNTGTLGLI